MDGGFDGGLVVGGFDLAEIGGSERQCAGLEQGIVVIRASSSISGMVTKAEASYEEAGFIASGLLNPRKARLLLQVALVCGKSAADLRKFLV